MKFLFSFKLGTNLANLGDLLVLRLSGAEISYLPEMVSILVTLNIFFIYSKINSMIKEHASYNINTQRDRHEVMLIISLLHEFLLNIGNTRTFVGWYDFIPQPLIIINIR